MADIQIISNTRHANRTWQRNKDYGFTSQHAICPVVVAELPRAILSLPVGFTMLDGAYSPVAILGLEDGQNVVVDAAGNWRGAYIPNNYQCYPFSVAERDDTLFLCIDEEVAQVSESTTGEPFYDEEGLPTKVVQDLLTFLTANVTGAKKTAALCQKLSEFKLLEPWPIHYSIAKETKEVAGLYRINEVALNKLSPELFTELRDSGALLLAYCQLLSMTHLQSLIMRAQNLKQSAGNEPNFDDFANDGTISFDNL
ncbi:MAG: hypothetical protein ACI95C_002180 [Pseudohongiellaceae bacterium]